MKKVVALAAASLLAAGAAQAQAKAVAQLVAGPFSNSAISTVTGLSTSAGETHSAGASWVGLSRQAPAAPYVALDTSHDDGKSFAGLAAGAYAHSFAGSVQGGEGGHDAVISMVPEPETYGLVVAGLAAAGGYIGLRRR